MDILIILGIIFYVIYRKSLKDNDKAKERARRIEEMQRGQTPGAGMASAGNRALEALKRAAKSIEDVPQPVIQPQKEMPIEKRRKSQQATADKSRIHQNLHQKEKQEEIEKRIVEQVKTEEIRFGEGELMNEVYDIIACGYPNGKAGQRDFLAEGMELIDRYTLN